MGRILFLAALAIAAWLVFGPPSMARLGQGTPVTLAQLAADPGHWDGREIAVTARVIDRVTILGLGGLLIDDGAGHEILAAGFTGLAAPGSEITVRGIYRLAFGVGDAQFPVILVPESSGPGN